MDISIVILSYIVSINMFRGTWKKKGKKKEVNLAGNFNNLNWCGELLITKLW